MSYQQEYLRWLNAPILTQAEKSELQAIQGDEKEKESRFYAPLQFGTAGLRGTMAVGLHHMNVYVVRQVTQAMAQLVLAEKAGNRGVAIAYDSRNNSELFAREAACVLAANGVKAYLFDEMRPTPELSFAIRTLKCIAGINITASHNPKEYNGYKAYWEDGAQLPPEHASTVEKAVAQIDIFNGAKTTDYEAAVASGMIQVIGPEIDEQFLAAALSQSVDAAPIKRIADRFKLVYTPFHGAGYKLVPEALRRVGFKNIIYVQEQMIPDGNFPTVKSPNPEDRAGFKLAIELAEANDAALIIGTDPDSDRVGLVAKNAAGSFEVLSGNQTGVLLLDYLIGARQRTGTMPAKPFTIKTIVTTDMARTVSEKNGIPMYDTFTGFKFIAEKINELQKHQNTAIFSYEESFGYLVGDHARDKDAVTAALLLAEMAAYYFDKGMNVFEALQSLYARYGNYAEETVSLTMKGLDGLQRMKDLMTAFRDDQVVFPDSLKTVRKIDYLSGTEKDLLSGKISKIDLDGSDVLSFILEGGTKLMVRPSGTEPKIKFYLLAAADTMDKAKFLRDEMKRFVYSFE